MNFSLANSFVLNSSSKASAIMIFLHGLGDNGAGWAYGFNEIKNKNVKYIFPNAPSIPVTINGGYSMPAWYDLKSLDRTHEDKDGIMLAAKSLREFITNQLNETGLCSSQVFLGGFSMGGALALYTALTNEEPLGGVIALSCYLPLSKLFENSTEGHSLTTQKCEIFQAHGDSDAVVTLSYGQRTHDILQLGRNEMPKSQHPTFKVYPGMGHESCPQEMEDIKALTNKWLSTKEKSSL